MFWLKKHILSLEFSWKDFQSSSFNPLNTRLTFSLLSIIMISTWKMKMPLTKGKADQSLSEMKIPLVWKCNIINNHTWKILYHNLEVIFTRIIKIRLILTNAFVIEITGLVRLLVKRRRNLKISKAATVAAQNYVYWGETI